MKLNGSMLVVVAMMVGSLGAMGCKTSEQSAQPEGDVTVSEQPAAETAKTETPATNESATILAKASVAVGQQAPAQRVYVPQAPPAPRFENRGRAPSARHFWVSGHWQPINGRFVWINGRWDTRREGQRFVQPRHHREGSRWVYVPGHWERVRR